MNVLVTGGLGFLGSHLLEQLLAADPDVRVYVVDNMASNVVGPEFVKRLDRVSVMYQSLQASNCPDVCGARFDEIYHLASIVGPVGVLKRAGRIASSVIRDADSALEIARYHHARLCYVSTSEVYGGGRSGLCAETDPQVFHARASARCEYAAGKLAAEVMVLNSGVPATIVRPFNIAGARQRSAGGFVLPRFIEQALKGEPLTVYGDGSQVRAFTHVVDLAQGLIAATRKGVAGQTYNLGNPDNKTTIIRLAHLVRQLTRSSSRLEHVQPQTLHGPAFEDAPDKFPDASLAMRDLGWKPERDLVRVVMDAIKYLREGRVD